MPDENAEQSGTTQNPDLDVSLDDNAASNQNEPPVPNPSPDPSASTMGTSETQSQDDGSTPNVVLSAERLDEGLPEGLTNIGTVGVTLPNAEAQAAGFYLPFDKASRLVAQFRQYKFLVNKGQATPAVRIGE